MRIWSVARSAAEIAINRSAYVDPTAPGLERLYRFDDSTTDVVDRTGNSATSPLPAGVTFVASAAPVALDPAVPVAPGPNAEVTAYVYDRSDDYALAHDDVLLAFDGTTVSSLTRRWVHTLELDEPLGVAEYQGQTSPGSGSALELYSGRQGSILSVVDIATGAAVNTVSYGSFGTRRAVSGSAERLFGYTGRHFDAESGLNYFRARHYSPMTGGFFNLILSKSMAVT